MDHSGSLESRAEKADGVAILDARFLDGDLAGNVSRASAPNSRKSSQHVYPPFVGASSALNSSG